LLATCSRAEKAGKEAKNTTATGDGSSKGWNRSACLDILVELSHLYDELNFVIENLVSDLAHCGHSSTFLQRIVATKENASRELAQNIVRPQTSG
jgi:hypothetical protein